MARVLAISGSPSIQSRTTGLLSYVGSWLTAAGHAVEILPARELPAAELLTGQVEHPAIRALVASVDRCDGLVVATPVYKAAYSGLLKATLDVLSQYALQDKVVLPLATGGSTAHVLAIDYALRPVLSSLGARHILPGWFVLDQQVTVGTHHEVSLDPDVERALEPIVGGFDHALSTLPATLARPAHLARAS